MLQECSLLVQQCQAAKNTMLDKPFSLPVFGVKTKKPMAYGHCGNGGLLGLSQNCNSRTKLKMDSKIKEAFALRGFFVAYEGPLDEK